MPQTFLSTRVRKLPKTPAKILHTIFIRSDLIKFSGNEIDSCQPNIMSLKTFNKLLSLWFSARIKIMNFRLMYAFVLTFTKFNMIYWKTGSSCTPTLDGANFGRMLLFIFTGTEPALGILRGEIPRWVDMGCSDEEVNVHMHAENNFHPYQLNARTIHVLMDTAGGIFARDARVSIAWFSELFSF